MAVVMSSRDLTKLKTSQVRDWTSENAIGLNVVCLHSNLKIVLREEKGMWAENSASV